MERRAPGVVKLLAHDIRWHLLQELSRSDRKVHELVDRVGQPQNLVSYHLGQLRRGHLVTERRSSVDARDVYYSLETEQLRRQISQCAATIDPGFTLLREPASVVQLPSARRPAPTLPRRRVLFLCTGNSARSQIAEAITRNFSEGDLRALSLGPVEAHSAGSQPGAVHPMTLRVLHDDLGISTANQRSKHLSEYLGEQFDFVITLCDVVREVCPPFPGGPELIHWSIPDPAAIDGPEEAVHRAFKDTSLHIASRVRHLLVRIGWERAQQPDPGAWPGS